MVSGEEQSSIETSPANGLMSATAGHKDFANGVLRQGQCRRLRYQRIESFAWIFALSSL